MRSSKSGRSSTPHVLPSDITVEGVPIPPEVLRRRPRLYRRMYVQSPIGIVLYDHEGRLVAANKACRAMVGMPRHFEVSRWFSNLFSDPTIPDEVKKRLKNCQVSRYEAEIDYNRLKEEGVYRGDRSGICYVDVAMTPLRQKRNGNLIGYMTQVQDVTSLKLAQKMVNDYQARLRSLSSQLSLVEEKERRRLASGLHDDVGQTLALIRFSLSALKSDMGDKHKRARVSEIQAMVDEAAEETRALVFELSPPVLYELGLEPALEWLAEQYETKFGIPIRFRRAGKPMALSDELRGTIFSSVRELLTNAVKHAEAKSIRISVGVDGGDLSVSVRDDGVGFDATAAKSHPGGFGLFNMRERLEAAGGHMGIKPAPGHGTTVTLTVPLGTCDDAVWEGQ
jgi:PAS domain S-box-containing protein